MSSEAPQLVNSAAPAPGRRFLVLRLLLGAGLLITAALKAHGLVLDPVSQDSFLASPRLQVGVIELEILLGLWLLSGWATRAAWAMALGFFGLLAAASFYLGWEGQASCGCFGKVHVNPWVTFGMDVAVVAALALWRPNPVANKRSFGSLGAPLSVAGGALLIMLVIGSIFFFLAESPTNIIANLRGEPVTVSPAVYDVGSGKPREFRTFKIELANHLDQPVRIVGGTSNCSCITTEDLPVTVPPQKSRSIKVRIRFSGSAGRFQHPFILYTDNARQPTLTARFAGRVVVSVP